MAEPTRGQWTTQLAGSGKEQNAVAAETAEAIAPALHT